MEISFKQDIITEEELVIDIHGIELNVGPTQRHRVLVDIGERACDLNNKADFEYVKSCLFLIGLKKEEVKEVLAKYRYDLDGSRFFVTPATPWLSKAIKGE